MIRYAKKYTAFLFPLPFTHHTLRMTAQQNDAGQILEKTSRNAIPTYIPSRKLHLHQRVFSFADFHLVVIAVLELNNRVHILVSFFVDDYGALDD